MRGVRFLSMPLLIFIFFPSKRRKNICQLGRVTSDRLVRWYIIGLKYPEYSLTTQQRRSYLHTYGLFWASCGRGTNQLSSCSRLVWSALDLLDCRATLKVSIRWRLYTSKVCINSQIEVSAAVCPCPMFWQPLLPLYWMA